MAEDRPGLEIPESWFFTAWLACQRASLAFTTYQADKLFLIARARTAGRRSSNAAFRVA